MTDPTSPGSFGGLEYKNPYKVRINALLEAATQANDFYPLHNNDSLSLKCTHSYYYQVQEALYCTQHTWCGFVLCTSTDLHIERLLWDPSFWSAVMPRLQEFYFTAILPELADAHQHQEGIHEPSSWLKDTVAWRKETEGL